MVGGGDQCSEIKVARVERSGRRRPIHSRREDGKGLKGGRGDLGGKRRDKGDKGLIVDEAEADDGGN